MELKLDSPVWKMRKIERISCFCYTKASRKMMFWPQHSFSAQGVWRLWLTGTNCFTNRNHTYVFYVFLKIQKKNNMSFSTLSSSCCTRFLEHCQAVKFQYKKGRKTSPPQTITYTCCWWRWPCHYTAKNTPPGTQCNLPRGQDRRSEKLSSLRQKHWPLCSSRKWHTSAGSSSSGWKETKSRRARWCWQRWPQSRTEMAELSWLNARTESLLVWIVVFSSAESFKFQIYFIS